MSARRSRACATQRTCGRARFRQMQARHLPIRTTIRKTPIYSVCISTACWRVRYACTWLLENTPIFLHFMHFLTFCRVTSTPEMSLSIPPALSLTRLLSRRYRALPYVTVRVSWMTSTHFKADYTLAAVRAEHQAFYRRTFGHYLVCEPRPYPQLEKPISLMAVHYPSAAEDVFRRYPFFRSTFFERRMMFERQAAPGIQPNHDTADGNEPSSGQGNISPFRERGSRCLTG